MKFALVLAAVLVVASAKLHPLVVQHEWDIFNSKHVKVYENVEEEAKRMGIFHQNLVKIEEHNKLYQQGLSTFKVGVTQFADMTSAEFRDYLNKSAIIGHPQDRGEKVVPYCSNVTAFPVKVVGFHDIAPSIENVRSGIANQPLSVSVDATNAWQLYSGGVLEDKSCNPKTVNHGVLAVGYNPQLWIIKNSWGTDCGEDGYIRLSITNNCGVKDYASFPKVA